MQHKITNVATFSTKENQSFSATKDVPTTYYNKDYKEYSPKFRNDINYKLKDYEQKSKLKMNGNSRGFDQYKNKRVTSVKFYSDDIRFELQNGQTAIVPHSKIVDFTEKTTLANDVKLSFFKFQDCDAFFDTLNKNKLLFPFVKNIKHATFQHYLSLNGFRNFIKAAGPNLVELRLKNLLLDDAEEENKNFSKNSNGYFPDFVIKDLIKTLIQRSTSLKVLTIDLRFTYVLGFEYPALFLYNSNMPKLDFLQIQVNILPSRKFFSRADEQINSILSNNGRCVVTFDKSKRSFPIILETNGYFITGESQHCAPGSEKFKQKYQVFEREGSKIEYHLILSSTQTANV